MSARSTSLGAEVLRKWIGEYLRRRRKACGLSASAASRRVAGVDVHDVENFERRGPPASLQPLLAYALAVHATDRELLALATPEGSRLRRTGIEGTAVLARKRVALGRTQERLQTALAFPVSRPFIARLERGEVALSAQKLVLYAASIGADLRLIAELLSIAPSDDSAHDGGAPPLLAVRTPARLGQLGRAIAILASSPGDQAESHDPASRPRRILSLAIAFSLDRRWRAARLLTEIALDDPFLDEMNRLRARVHLASILTALRDTASARRELSALHAEASDHAELGPFVLLQRGLAYLDNGALGAAATNLGAAAKRSLHADLTLAALTEHAMAAARARDPVATRRSLARARDLEHACHPAVTVFRKTQLAKAARLCGFGGEAATLAHEAIEDGAAIGAAASVLLALIELREAAALEGDTHRLRDLDEQVLGASAGVYLDDRLRNYCLRVAAGRPRSEGRRAGA